MPTEPMLEEEVSGRYSRYYTVPTEGYRIGLATCLRCGAAIVIDENGATELHDKFHGTVDYMKGVVDAH